MDLLAAFRTFVRVAEAGSFSAVARELGSTQPAVSRQVATLEEYLGTRLMHRTTRSLALTEDGRDMLGHARRVLDTVEEAESAVGRRHASLSGLVRLATSATFGRLYVAPRIPRLLERFPELSVELHVSDHVQDLVAEGLDLAIRAVATPDSSLVARKIGSTTRVTVASAGHIAQYGQPAFPAELAQHTCLIALGVGNPHVWTYDGPDGPMEVQVTGRFRTDSGEALREAVLAGMGFAVLPTWFFGEELASGEVLPVLQDWQPPRGAINAVYPSRRNLAPRTRAVIDFFVDEFRVHPVISSYGETA